MAGDGRELQLDPRWPSLVPLAPRVPLGAPQAPDGAPEAASGAVDCQWGCRGTIHCLCGQGELSDNPLWMEADLGTW